LFVDETNLLLAKSAAYYFYIAYGGQSLKQPNYSTKKNPTKKYTTNLKPTSLQALAYEQRRNLHIEEESVIFFSITPHDIP